MAEDFVNSDNFFPIATIEYIDNGQTVPIHIIYTFFQGSNADGGYFIEEEYGGSFSMDLVDGYCRPTFRAEALKINEDYQKFLDEAKGKYKSATNQYKFAPVEFAKEPEWWQGDDTPVDEQGRSLKFICQADLVDIVDDDCRLYVFYDSGNKRIKYVYQRD